MCYKVSLQTFKKNDLQGLFKAFFFLAYWISWVTWEPLLKNTQLPLLYHFSLFFICPHFPLSNPSNEGILKKVPSVWSSAPKKKIRLSCINCGSSVKYCASVTAIQNQKFLALWTKRGCDHGLKPDSTVAPPLFWEALYLSHINTVMFEVRDKKKTFWPSNVKGIKKIHTKTETQNWCINCRGIFFQNNKK